MEGFVGQRDEDGTQVNNDKDLWTLRKCLFLGYADGVKGYRLWDPTAHKVVVIRDVVFMEDKSEEIEERDSTTRETTSIQIEKQFHSSDSFEVVPQYEEGEPSTLQEALNN
ncbi:hypothetical protein CTI12_AA141140 [Artemisia annua]|uniref:Retroviral polymerase SH3-like domain-containing protein n=1 Tax=Artemisia annua TaxID=35608 RepID=A0A2U1PKW9_ARTAN|nr:hypothetical protein CTI12_AA141140 [Artemisia annua]